MSSAARDKWITCPPSYTVPPPCPAPRLGRHCRVQACPRGWPGLRPRSRTSPRRRARGRSRRRRPTPSCLRSGTRRRTGLPTKRCLRGISLPAARDLSRPGLTRFRWDTSWPRIRSLDRYSSSRPRVLVEGPAATSLGVSGPRRRPRGTTTTTAPTASSVSLLTPVTPTLQRRLTWHSTTIT